MQHTYNKWHTEGVKKKKSAYAYTDWRIKWTRNHLPAKPQRSMSLALSQFKTPPEAKYTKICLHFYNTIPDANPWIKSLTSSSNKVYSCRITSSWYMVNSHQKIYICSMLYFTYLTLKYSNMIKTSNRHYSTYINL